MKLALVLVGLLAIASFAFAEDGNNVADQLGDIITGHNDNVPTNLSIEVAKQIDLGVCAYQIGIEGRTPMGDGFRETGEVTIKNRFIF